MKKQILDSPFRDSFSDFLEEKEETILWTGQPDLVRPKIFFDAFGKPNKGYEKHFYWGVTILGTIAVYLLTEFKPFALMFLGLSLITFIIRPWWMNKLRNGIQYAFTQHQILFQIHRRWRSKPKFHSIPFSNVKDILVIMKVDMERIQKRYRDAGEYIPDGLYPERDQKIGTIFIALHDPEKIDFETQDLSNNNKRHQPTLELLENVEDVAKLMRENFRS